MFTGLFASVALPVIVDWIKTAAPTITRKMFGESVDDQVKLENAAVARLEALSKLDNPYGVPSQWVINLRGAFRYIAAAALIVAGIFLAVFGALQVDDLIVAIGVDVATSPFGFIFGERLVLSFKGGNR